MQAAAPLICYRKDTVVKEMLQKPTASHEPAILSNFRVLLHSPQCVVLQKSRGA